MADSKPKVRQASLPAKVARRARGWGYFVRQLSVVGQRDMTLCPCMEFRMQWIGQILKARQTHSLHSALQAAPQTATVLHAAPGWTSLWAWGRTAVTHPEKRSGFSAAWDGGQKWSVFTADCVPRRTNLGPGGGGNKAAMWVNAVLGYEGRRVRDRELCIPTEDNQRALFIYRRQPERDI